MLKAILATSSHWRSTPVHLPLLLKSEEDRQQHFQEERRKVFLPIELLSLRDVAKENTLAFNKLWFGQHLLHAVRTVRRCGHISHVSWPVSV